MVTRTSLYQNVLFSTNYTFPGSCRNLPSRTSFHERLSRFLPRTSFHEHVFVEICSRFPRFIMLEHLLAARLQLINKRSILLSLVKEGVMKETDVNHILETVIEPSFACLTNWIPSAHLVELMRAFCWGGGSNRPSLGGNFRRSKTPGGGNLYPQFRSTGNVLAGGGRVAGAGGARREVAGRGPMAAGGCELRDLSGGERNVQGGMEQGEHGDMEQGAAKRNTCLF